MLGYWGYGDHLDLKLAKLTDEAIEIRSDRFAMTKTRFSACGRSNVNDVWVNATETSFALGRDAFGRVPLYWIKLDSAIWFSTQLKLLLSLIQPTVSYTALYAYSCFSYVPTPLSPVEEISAIAAGTLVTWTQDFTFTVSDLEDWRESGETIYDESEAARQLQGLLSTAIAHQISDLPDEPVGVFLSGGIDSSIVAALLVQAGVKVRAYALDFGVEDSELPYAQQVADYLKIPLILVPAQAKQIIRAISKTARALDVPYGDGVTAALFLLNQAASQEVRVVFNGEHGDQLFAGWTNKPLIANQVYDSEKFSLSKQYLNTFGRLYGYESRIFSESVYERIREIDLQTYLGDALNPEKCASLLAQLRRASLMLKGAQNIQPRATALAQGLWVRSLFCDPDLTRWTFSIPGELMLQGACEKYILKRAVASWLPPEVVWREKRGMRVPLRPWYYGEFWHEIGQWLNPGVLRAEGRWQPKIAEQMMSGQMGVNLRDRYLGNNLWLLIMWQAWRIEVLGESAENYAWDHPFWMPPQVWQGWRRVQNAFDRLG
ncbi:MAG: asparagine synthetase B family protein [Leptolyngbya sp. Prado105]|jgi:asparagine synthase (glutamine-hydrolysing)|nr:asparagine synthetase B family protein [Leptolyngbya sp. Prado105]